MGIATMKKAAAFAFQLAVFAALGGCAAMTHHRAGLAAFEQEAYVEAVTELETAANLAPGDVRYQQDWLVKREAATRKLLALGDKALEEGKPDVAAEHFQTILKYDRYNARALSGLELLQEVTKAGDDAKQAREALKRGDSAQALQWANRALERIPNQREAQAVKREIEAAQAIELMAAPNLGNFYKKPVNLEFRDASIRMVFDALSRTTGINFIFDRDVRGDQRTTINVKQTTLEDAVDVLLTVNQLEKKVLNATSVLIYPNTPAKLKEYQDLVVKAFYLSNTDAKTVANLIKTVLKIKDVYVDEKYHMLVLRENLETLALAEKLIALQDLDEPEVMLEVEVLEINRNRLLNLGIQVTNQITVSPLPTSGLPSTGTGTNQQYRLSDLKTLNADKLGVTLPSVTLSLQKTDGDANLLANPRLRVRDREKAKILIGDKVPVVTTTTTPNGFLSENIQYLDVGLKLDVEPEIHLRDEVSLKLALEVSSLVGVVKTATGSQAYQIGTRNFSSSLRLKDGETQILAGLISDADRSDATRIPVIGDVPVLGRLFSSQKDDRQKTEIVMSITPHLIRNIQRKSVVAESFWSGTEATLRTKAVQLRSAMSAGGQATAAPTGEPVPGAAGAGIAQAAPDTSGLKFSWKAPVKAKVGQSVTLDLQLDSQHSLRAAPLQLVFNPTQFEFVAVKEGDFFNKAGKSSFSEIVDKANGRITIGLASGEATGAKGEGRLLSVELKPIAPAAAAEVSVIGVTPVGAGQAVARPKLPVTVQLSVEP
ncbi:general secretion pathway protein GspD [Oxalobacteraceae bacterium OM1]|nr:general secretion pathway protein GspD [Oxalobacteraceae bacterium OM1]